MNERVLHPLHIAAAALVLGGGLLLVLPQYALSIVRLVLVTVAAATALWAFTVDAPPTWWHSPFDRWTRAERRAGSTDDTDWIRATLSGPRQATENGPPLPPGALRLLQPLIRADLERAGLDLEDDEDRATARATLSPIAWAVLATRPLDRPRWYQVRRPDAERTAHVIHHVLDDLDRRTGAADSRTTVHPRTT